MSMLTLTSFYIYCVFFSASAYIELISFNTLNSFEKEIVVNRKKLPFMTNFSSTVKVFIISFLIIYMTPSQMQFRRYLYSNTEELVFIYQCFMVFFIVGFVPIIKFLQKDIRNDGLPGQYLKNILVGDYIHLWGILLACYLSIPNFG